MMRPPPRAPALGPLVLTTSLFGGAAAQEPPGRRTDPPNIVLFIADDLSVSDTEPYGNPVVRTPALERLQRESLRFTSAFAVSPTCAPSRSSLYTGLMPFRNGAHANHSGTRPGTPSLVQRLGPLGYDVALAGKLHVGPRDVFPFDLIAGTNVPEPGHEEDGVLYTDLELGPVDRWLSERGAGRPFALIVADHSPHVIWPDSSTYEAANVDVPATHIDTPELRHSRGRYYTDVSKMDRNLGRLLELLERHGLEENTLFLFTSDQGPQFPFGKWTLYDEGVRVPLLVRWPGRVPAGATTDALVSLVDVLPTLVEAGGGDAPGDIDGRTFLDVLEGRTDTHRAHVFATHTGDGTMNRSPARMVRTARYKYILNLNPDSLYHTHMDRARGPVSGAEYWASWRERSFQDEHAAAVLWRYHHQPPQELYDLEADPSERVNLAGDPRHARLLADLHDRLLRWRAEQGDDRTGPEPVTEPPPGPPVAPYIF
jgi:N-sulfoglucosamine sulfohydrolase